MSNIEVIADSNVSIVPESADDTVVVLAADIETIATSEQGPPGPPGPAGPASVIPGPVGPQGTSVRYGNHDPSGADGNDRGTLLPAELAS